MFQCQKELLDSMYCTPTTTSDIFNVVCVCSAQNTVFAFSKSVNDEFLILQIFLRRCGRALHGCVYVRPLLCWVDLNLAIIIQYSWPVLLATGGGAAHSGEYL